MNTKTINVGEKVLWRGSWGLDTIKEVVIVHIERTNDENSKNGIGTVESVTMDMVTSEWEHHFICTLDNGKWAYSDQIRPM